MGLAEKFHRVTRALCYRGAFAVLILMVIVITIDVTGRYVFASPLHGAQDIVGMALFTLFVLILPYSFRGDFHVRMDLLYSHFPGWAQRIANIFGALGAAIFAGALVFQTFVNIPRFYTLGAGTLEVGILFWPFNVLLLVTSFIMLVSVVLTVFGKQRTTMDDA